MRENEQQIPRNLLRKEVREESEDHHRAIMEKEAMQAQAMEGQGMEAVEGEVPEV